MAEDWRDWKKIAEGQEANVASLSALVDKYRAALREAETQRDDANGCLKALGMRYDEQRERAEAAERKVDEYRQALQRMKERIEVTHWNDAGVTLAWVLVEVSRDALRVEQPRECPHGCKAGGCAMCSAMGCPTCHGPDWRKWQLAVERGQSKPDSAG